MPSSVSSSQKSGKQVAQLQKYRNENDQLKKDVEKLKEALKTKDQQLRQTEAKLTNEIVELTEELNQIRGKKPIPRSEIIRSDARLDVWKYGTLSGTLFDRFRVLKNLLKASPKWIPWGKRTEAEQQFFEKNGFFPNEQTRSLCFEPAGANCAFDITLDFYEMPEATDYDEWLVGFSTRILWKDNTADRAGLDVKGRLALQHVCYARGWFEVKPLALKFWRDKGAEVLDKIESAEAEKEKEQYTMAVDEIEKKLNLRFTRPIPQSRMLDFFSKVDDYPLYRRIARVPRDRQLGTVAPSGNCMVSKSEYVGTA